MDSAAAEAEAAVSGLDGLLLSVPAAAASSAVLAAFEEEGLESAAMERAEGLRLRPRSERAGEWCVPPFEAGAGDSAGAGAGGSAGAEEDEEEVEEEPEEAETADGGASTGAAAGGSAPNPGPNPGRSF